MERANSRELIEHYDPFSEELHRNLASMYHALRNDCPVHKFERFEYPLYTVTRHADVKDMLKDQALWSSRYGQAPMYIEENGLVSDAPMHDMYRRMLNPIFTTRRVNALKEKIEMMVDRQIDSFIQFGQGDLHQCLHAVFPISAAAELLGIDPAFHADFRRWTQQFIQGQLTGDSALVERIRGLIAGYFAPLLDARRELLARSPGIRSRRCNQRSRYSSSSGWTAVHQRRDLSATQ